jgi:Telomere-capping, CST complex subunit
MCRILFSCSQPSNSCCLTLVLFLSCDSCRLHSTRLAQKLVIIHDPMSPPGIRSEADESDEEASDQGEHGTRKKRRKNRPLNEVHVDVGFLDAAQMPHGEGTFWQFIGELSRPSVCDVCACVCLCVCVRCVTSVCRMVSGFCRLWGRPREGCNAFVPLSQLEAHLDYLSFSCGSISFEHTHTHTHTLSLSLLNSLSQETQAPVVKARISRNVNGMDLNLYHETVLLLRQYLESST